MILSYRYILFLSCALFLGGFSFVNAQTTPTPSLTTSTPQKTFPGLAGETVTIPMEKIVSPVVARRPENEIVYRTDFGASSDLNEDRWPDNWERFSGPGFPQYQDMQLISRRTLFGTGVFRITIQRGGATVFSPRIKIINGLTYSGKAYVLSSGLEHNRVFMSISLLDASGTILKTAVSEVVVNTEGWFPLTTPPLTADLPNARSVAIGLHVTPTKRQDLQAMVEFGQVLVLEQPTITFEMTNPWQIYTDPNEISIHGNIFAVDPNWDAAKLELKDVYGNVLASKPLMDSGSMENGPYPAKQFSSQQEKPEQEISGETSPVKSIAGQYHFQWSPAIPSVGFYTVVVSLPSKEMDTYLLQEMLISTGTFPFVLLKPGQMPDRGMYGWAFSEKMDIDELNRLKPLLMTGGISRLKFPLWLSDQTPEDVWKQYLDFGEWLVDNRIRGVGVLAFPPDNLLVEWQKQLSLPQKSSATTPATASVPQPARPLDVSTAVNIFSLPIEMWFPSIEATLYRLGMLIPDWQMSVYNDRSLENHPDLPQMLLAIKSRLEQNGLDASIGFAWDWLQPFPVFPHSEKKIWGFLALSNDLPLTASDLEYYLDATKTSRLRRDLVLVPLGPQYQLDVRIAEMIEKMIVANVHGADGVFIPGPFNPNYSFLDRRGMPGELFLPWRTTALITSGKEGSNGISTPAESTNYVFRDAADTIMVIWNDKPAQETMFFGKNAVVTDVWGNEFPPKIGDFQQTVDVGPLPVFIAHLNDDVMGIRQHCTIEQNRIPSVYGTKIPNKFSLTNTSSLSLGGRLTIVPPRGINIEPQEFPLNLFPGETIEKDFSMVLTPEVVSGAQLLRFDIASDLNDAPNFSVYHHISVGAGDISIDLTTRLNRMGELEVHQAFINDSPNVVNFTCTLYIPDRPLQKMSVRNLGSGRHDYTYTIENGAALLGKTLRVVAREVGGRRVLRYQFKAEK
ncbi:MAG: hypothetical protein FWC50_11820 [Planctomycetaceae bacterium]|nr:hypothetical protein [Planctomycetaceae bacterium]